MKKATSVTLDIELVSMARAQGLNISKILNRSLKEYMAEHQENKDVPTHMEKYEENKTTSSQSYDKWYEDQKNREKQEARDKEEARKEIVRKDIQLLKDEYNKYLDEGNDIKAQEIRSRMIQKAKEAGI